MHNEGMNLMEYLDKDASRIILGGRIGYGGQGAVYDVSNWPGVAAKIYHPGKVSDDTYLKIAAMLRNRPQTPADGRFRIAWPIGIVYTRQGGARLAGYLMRKLDTDEFHEIGRYLNPYRRKRRLQERRRGFAYVHLALMARHLAAAVATLHQQGYVIGDLNSKNVLASDTGQIALIDTDSFQVRDPISKEIYRCPVGVPDYTPPELQGIEFSGVDRAVNHDLFSLSVMIYQLLFQGRHPFDGIYEPSRGGRELPQIDQKIRYGHFVHAASGQPIYKPHQESSLIWDSLPTLLQWLFRGGLKRKERTTSARSWVKGIDQATQFAQRCQINELHYYFGAKGCVWCKYQKVTSIDPFPSVSGVAATGRRSTGGRRPRRRPGARRPTP